MDPISATSHPTYYLQLFLTGAGQIRISEAWTGNPEETVEFQTVGVIQPGHSSWPAQVQLTRGVHDLHEWYKDILAR